MSKILKLQNALKERHQNKYQNVDDREKIQKPKLIIEKTTPETFQEAHPAEKMEKFPVAEKKSAIEEKIEAIQIQARREYTPSAPVQEVPISFTKSNVFRFMIVGITGVFILAALSLIVNFSLIKELRNSQEFSRQLAENLSTQSKKVAVLEGSLVHLKEQGQMDVDDLKNQIDNFYKAMTDHDTQLVETNKQFSGFNEEIVHLNDVTKNSDSKIAELLTNNSLLQNMIADLKRTQDDLQKQNDTIKTQLDSVLNNTNKTASPVTN